MPDDDIDDGNPENIDRSRIEWKTLTASVAPGCRP